MDVKMIEMQKKQLEKIYNKIYEGTASEPILTEDGRIACNQLDINPADLIVRNFDYFKKGEGEHDEVVQIRYDHYRQRRYRK